MSRDAFDQFTPPDCGRFGDNEEAPRNSVSPRAAARIAELRSELGGHWRYGSGPFGSSSPDRRHLQLELERLEGASNLIDLTLHLRHEKPAAIAVIPTDKISVKWTWLPRSMIEFVRKGAQDSTLIEVTLPEWLARKKGLI